MGKRFTDTDKWDRPWFRNLPRPYREFWIYILDKCDVAGVWYVDMERASFYLSEKVDLKEAKKYLGKQIIELDGGQRWFIKQFIHFQYGPELKEFCAPHQGVLKTLKANGVNVSLCEPKVIGYTSQVKSTIEKTENPNNYFEDFWFAYPKKVGKGAAEKAWAKINPSLQLKKIIVGSVLAHTETKQWQNNGGQFIPMPATYLNQKRWEDELEPQKIEEVDGYDPRLASESK